MNREIITPLIMFFIFIICCNLLSASSAFETEIATYPIKDPVKRGSFTPIGDFSIYDVLGNGHCGLYSINITREEAIKALEGKTKDDAVFDYHKKNWNIFVKRIQSYKEYLDPEDLVFLGHLTGRNVRIIIKNNETYDYMENVAVPFTDPVETDLENKNDVLIQEGRPTYYVYFSGDHFQIIAKNDDDHAKRLGSWKQDRKKETQYMDITQRTSGNNLTEEKEKQSRSIWASPSIDITQTLPEKQLTDAVDSSTFQQVMPSSLSLNFRASAFNLDEIHTSGLSIPEEWGTWSDTRLGKDIIFKFPYRLSGKSLLTFNGWNVLGPQFIAVCAILENGKFFPIGKMYTEGCVPNFDPGQAFIVDFDKINAPVVGLSFRPAISSSGYELDPRHLGIGFTDLNLTPVEAFPQEMRLDFRKNTYSMQDVIASGLSLIEEEGRWSDANVSGIVKINFKRYLPRKFKLKINGFFTSEKNKKVDLYGLREDGFSTFKIGEITFKINEDGFHTSFSAEIPLNEDAIGLVFIPKKPITTDNGRKLSIGFQTIEIKKKD